jgi:hypothetical protein
MEVRSTEPGVLDGLGVPTDQVQNGGHRHGGLITVVVEEAHGTIRPLPRLYLSTMPIFADRNIDSVKDSLRKLVLAVTKSVTREPVYLLFACEFDGRRGIYAGNAFNRSTYVRALTRMGARLSPHPYLTLTPEGSFEHDDGRPFRPSFILLGDGGSEEGVFQSLDGQLLFRIASRRLGAIGKEELALLARTLEGLEGVGANDPREALVTLQE